MEAPAQLEAELLSRRIVATRNALLKIAGVLVGLLQLLLGGILTLFAVPAVSEWSALTLGLRLTIAFWLLAGPLALVCGTWALVSLGRRRMPQWIGATAVISAGGVLIVGVLTHFIPCASPT